MSEWIVQLGSFAGVLAGILIIITAFLYFGKISSVENGGEVAMKLHNAAGTEVSGVSPRIFFYWVIFPISAGNQQIMPYYAALWRRTGSVVDAMKWSMYGISSKKDQKKFFFMILSSIISSLLVFSGVSTLVYGFVVSSELFIFVGVSLIVFGFVFQLYPTWVLKTKGMEYLDKTNISEKDKAKIRRLINIYFLIEILLLAERVIKLISEIKKNEGNN